jgi:hypothetical protein
MDFFKFLSAWPTFRSVFGWFRGLRAHLAGRRQARAGLPADLSSLDPLPGPSHLSAKCERGFWRLAEQLRRVEAWYGPRIAEAKRKLNWASEELMRARDSLHSVAASFEARYGFPPQLPPRRDGKRILGAAVLFACLEIPLNYAALLILGDQKLLTWVGVIGVAAALVGGAHQLGANLRDRRDPVKRALAIGFVALLLIVVGGVGYARTKVISSDAFSTGIAVNNFLIALLFVGANLLFLLVGTALSYTHSEPGRHLVEAAWRVYDRARRRELKAGVRSEKLERRLEATQGFISALVSGFLAEAKRLGIVYSTAFQVRHAGPCRPEWFRIDPRVPECFSKPGSQPKPAEKAAYNSWVR